jgi:hypothetical protein
MNKKSIKKLIESTKLLEEKVSDIMYDLDYINGYNPKDHSLVERYEIERALEERENNIVFDLIRVHKESLKMLEKIDPEAIREMGD